MSEQVELYLRQGRYAQATRILQNNPHTNSEVLYYLSRINELTGRFEKALDQGIRSLNLGSDNLDKLRSSIAMAYAYWRLFRFEDGLEILDEWDSKMTIDKAHIGTLHNIRGLILWKSQQLGQARKEFLIATDIREQVGDNYLLSYSLNNLGNTYLTMGDGTNAEIYYSQAKAIRENLGYLPSLAASHNSFGRLNDFLKSYDDAKRFHLKSLEIWKNVGNTQFVAKSYRFLAINAALQKNMDHAIKYFNVSDQHFESIPNLTDLQVNRRLKREYLSS